MKYTDNRQLWTDGWEFLKTPLNTTWEEMLSQKENFSAVEVPHDWLIYDTKNLYEDSFGWYRKTFEVSGEEAEKWIVRFDGVYMDSTVYINGQKAKDWKYGYTSFDVDMTDYLKAGTNEIVVLARHQSPNSRWYSGAGIYRNVWLRKTGKAYLPTDGTYVHITRISADPSLFKMDLETELVGEEGAKYTVKYYLSPEGGEEILLGEVNALGSGTACLSAEIENPALWEPENPQCYLLTAVLSAGRKILDTRVMTVGFKTVVFDSEKGLFVNDKPVKVHGVCEHHDLGCLGSAFHLPALERQFKILKEMGVNGIRTSHNPPAPEFMELADRMGFLIVSEAFDMWERSKTTYDYGRFFVEWAREDVKSWIRRDRNHPCLLMWSIGNEIYDTHADEHGQEITRRLMGYVREHDGKGNAVITIGSNYMPWENAQKCADIVKMAGYNYGEKYYAEHHKAHPDWIIYGSETASVVQSRGIYHFPLSQSILADEDEQCSSLGNSSTSWGAASTEKCITDDRDAKFAFGQFIWTGFDYIGEPTPYHTKNSYFGQIDTAGFEKDSYYIFQAEWTDGKKKPMVHLFPYWDFNPGQMIDVRAASNCAAVELLVNGKSKGIQKLDHQHGLSLLGNWKVPYEPGVITAIAYDEEGNKVAQEEKKSFEGSAQICLTADKHVLKADHQDLCFITIEALDHQGHPVENAADYVTLQVEGPARLLGMDNGDSTDYDQYKTNTRKLFSGKLLAVLASTDQAGDIKVTVSGDGLMPAQLLLEAKGGSKNADAYLENCAKETSEPVPYLPTRKVELSLEGEPAFGPERKELELEAKVLPEGAQPKLLWKVVNEAGIPLSTAKITEVPGSNGSRVKVTACGDGSFYVRCMAQEPGGKITIISHLEFTATGLGTAFLNPYEFISAGLYTTGIGEVSNGNDKGIATAWVGDTGVAFADVDFGEYGSDEITLPLFTFNNEEHFIEVWEGVPQAEGSTLIDTLQYNLAPIWNVYQEKTWKLPRRLKGVTTVGFLVHSKKLHLKGFSFTHFEKAYGELYAGEATRVYGDDFKVNGMLVEGIGNNVTLEFENMDFGKTGSTQITIKGWTPLPVNTVHIRFNPEDGTEVQARMAEFRGDGTSEYHEQVFAIEKIHGKGRLDFIFLPGCQFNMESFRFRKEEE